MDYKSLMDALFEYGIDTYVSGIETSISTTNQREIPISKQISQPIGLIFGLSTYADTVTPANDPLISTTEAENLYLTFKDGPDEFFEPIRMDALIFNFSGFPNTNANRYLHVNIQANFDLSTSFYSNPTGIVSDEEGTKTIMLNLWYISTESYLFLIDQGVVKIDPKKYLKTKR